MPYRWKPNASQRKAFAEKMQDPAEREAYEARKAFKNSYAGFKDRSFIPTQMQYEHAVTMLSTYELTPEQTNACNQVMYGYSCQERIHHDNIHIVNEHQRSN